MMMRTQVAAVSYLNTIPFIYGIEHSGVNLSADLLLSPPSGCAASLREGRAQIALIPVAAIPSIKDIDIITPYCLGCSGVVRTVILASHCPVEQINTIYLDTHSLSSVRLARILAQERWSIEPEWRELSDYSILMDENPDTGFIIIGDKVFDYEDRFQYKYDLAREWRELTGLPFVFALWVARRGVSAETINQLEESLRYGVGHIKEAITCYGYDDKPYAYDYLTNNIDFVFDSQKRSAVELYWNKGMKFDALINPG